MTATLSSFKSPDGDLTLEIANTGVKITDPNRTRFGIVEAGAPTLTSEDGTTTLEVENDNVVAQTVSGAFYPPAMTTTQRDAITAVSNGAIIYNNTTNEFNFRENGAWITKN